MGVLLVMFANCDTFFFILSSAIVGKADCSVYMML